MISGNLHSSVRIMLLILFYRVQPLLFEKHAPRLPLRINNSQKLIPRWQTKFLSKIPSETFAPRANLTRSVGKTVCAWNTAPSHIRVNLTSKCAQMCVLSRHSREKTPWRNNRVVCNARRGIVRGCKGGPRYGPSGEKKENKTQKKMRKT